MKQITGLIICSVITLLVGINIGVNSPKECQVFPASECPSCICPEYNCSCEEVNCIDEVIKEQILAEKNKEKIKEVIS